MAKNILFLGDGGVGKTTFIQQLLTSKHTPKYNPTLGFEVHPYHFYDNGVKKKFDIYDFAGQEVYSHKHYPLDISNVVIFYDSTSNISKNNAYARWTDIANGAKILYVCTKTDLSPGVDTENLKNISLKQDCDYNKIFKYFN